MNKKIKVIIADDLKSFRDGLRIFLQLAGIEIIGEAINGKHLLELLEVKKLIPDVILLDVDMPEMDGVEALIKVKEFDPNIKIIMLTLYKNDDLINDLKGKGANCFFNKDVGIDQIASTIRQLVHNVQYSNISKKIKPVFTQVEIEIMLLLKDRKTTSEIAKIRGKSVKSIEAHRKKMYEKTGVTNASEFGSFCTREGLYFIGRKAEQV